jgi:hypothetical protein
MRAALDVFWETARDWYNGMVGLAVLNFVWLTLSLTVILLPPATAGLAVITHSLAHGTGAHFSDFWPGMQRYAWLSYRWALVNAAAVVIFAVCFSFYGAAGGVLGVLLQMLFVSAGLVWLATQFYVWPFLMEQEDKRLRLALKNALFLTLANPVYTFTLLGTAALGLVLSVITILPIAVFATSFISLLGSRAVLERLTTYGKLPGLVESGEP